MKLARKLAVVVLGTLVLALFGSLRSSGQTLDKGMWSGLKWRSI